ncbi:MAG: glycosyltransferase family 2 protein [Candidatus Eremiobacteraeota bacterium]|nr:glycosyltransferase family 2 protein [Candidatus Eremiobacteraeota bacterium]
MQPRLSVVIPVYNNWWLTARALRELDRLRDGLTFEVIVVDNGSTDETPAGVAGFPWVRHLRMERNRNFAGGCNAGARAAEAELILFLNNDAYPLGDALTPIVRAFDRDEVAIAGGALFFEDGITQCAGFVVLPNAHWHYSCRNLPADLVAVARSRDALGVSGAAMAVRRGWFLDGGGFDESFVNGFEDVDLCMRAREANRAIAYVAEARFAHYEGASQGRYDREMQNERRFYARWSAAFGAIPRVARGDVGAIAVDAASNVSPFSRDALEDLEAALRSFGHPVVRGKVRPWQRLDRRFQRAATLGWFSPADPGVTLERVDGRLPQLRVRGAAELNVAWLPCAAPERAAALPVRASLDPQCTAVAEIGGDSMTHWPAGDVACVVVRGLTDDAAFGNVVLAHAGIPTVIADERLRGFYAADCLGDSPAQFVESIEARRHFGSAIAADARRRFSPRRTAIRVVDLLCASRFGLETPAAAKSDSPFR